MRKSRGNLRNKNIVVVCEGTTTEHLYFEDLKRYLLQKSIIQEYELKIIPDIQESINKRSVRVKRHLMGNKNEWRYYEQTEKCEADYDNYKAQPVRYLREAQLFCDEGTYFEGWAVYDKDGHPALQRAEDMLKKDSRLHAAFSAYSFEEWILMHFEYTTKAFIHSECVDENGKECRCGVKKQTGHDCEGKECIGGYLRVRGYIPDFSKKTKEIFSSYTLTSNGDICPKAFVNAARLREYTSGNRICRGAYTDVDLLVLRLLKLDNTYKWVKFNEPIVIGSSTLLFQEDDNCIVVKNISDQSFLCTSESLYFCNEYGEYLRPVFSSKVLLGNRDDCKFRKEDYEYICLKYNDSYFFIAISAE